MKYQRTAKFIGQAGDPNPVTGVIVGETPSPAYKNACRLTIEIAPGERRILDVWGELLDPLINISEESSNWVGKRIQILNEEKIGEKRKRRIFVFK